MTIFWTSLMAVVIYGLLCNEPWMLSFSHLSLLCRYYQIYCTSLSNFLLLFTFSCLYWYSYNGFCYFYLTSLYNLLNILISILFNIYITNKLMHIWFALTILKRWFCHKIMLFMAVATCFRAENGKLNWRHMVSHEWQFNLFTKSEHSQYFQ